MPELARLRFLLHLQHFSGCGMSGACHLFICCFEPHWHSIFLLCRGREPMTRVYPADEDVDAVHPSSSSKAVRKEKKVPAKTPASSKPENIKAGIKSAPKLVGKIGGSGSQAGSKEGKVAPASAAAAGESKKSRIVKPVDSHDLDPSWLGFVPDPNPYSPVPVSTHSPWTERRSFGSLLERYLRKALQLLCLQCVVYVMVLNRSARASRFMSGRRCIPGLLVFANQVCRSPRAY